MYSDYTPRAKPSSPVLLLQTLASFSSCSNAPRTIQPITGTAAATALQKESDHNVLLLDVTVISLRLTITNDQLCAVSTLEAPETIEIKGPYAEHILALYLSFHDSGDWASLEELYATLLNSTKEMPHAVRMTEIAATEFISTQMRLSSPSRLRIFASVNSVNRIFAHTQVEPSHTWLYLHKVCNKKITELLATAKAGRVASDDAGVRVEACLNEEETQKSTSTTKTYHSRVRKQTTN